MVVGYIDFNFGITSIGTHVYYSNKEISGERPQVCIKHKFHKKSYKLNNVHHI